MNFIFSTYIALSCNLGKLFSADLIPAESVLLKVVSLNVVFRADQEKHFCPVPSPVVMLTQLSLEEDLVSEQADDAASALAALLCLFKEC